MPPSVPSDADAVRRPPLLPWWVVVAGATAAALWRLWLGESYAGWEESDYGNLAMIRGVLDGGFLHYDMNHMPGYYALGAVVLAIVDDAVVAGRVVSLVGGVAAWAIAVRLADRLGGPLAAALTGVLLLVQPEFALYAASSLREPVYAAFVLASLWTALGRRPLWAGAWAGAAFLVRFDAALVLGAVFVVRALGRGLSRDQRLRRLQALLPLVATAAAYSIYCRVDHGTFAFWSHAVQVNVETGLGAEAEAPGAWVANGLRVVAGLGAWLLPWRIGWGIWAGALAALVLTPWDRPSPERTAALYGGALLGFWLAVGMVGQHDPVHNLYWKWMLPLVPVLVPLGAVAVVRAARRLGPRWGMGLVGLVAAQALLSAATETRRQVELSAALYAPQRELGRWFEEQVDADVPLLIDNIPACWLDRRPHGRSLHSWFDVPVEPGDGAAFARWAEQEELGWVLWFREDWTQAPRVMPELAAGIPWSAGDLHLVPVAREDDYGWILYEVVRPEGRSGRSPAGAPVAIGDSGGGAPL